MSPAELRVHTVFHYTGLLGFIYSCLVLVVTDLHKLSACPSCFSAETCNCISGYKDISWVVSIRRWDFSG